MAKTKDGSLDVFDIQIVIKCKNRKEEITWKNKNII